MRRKRLNTEQVHEICKLLLEGEKLIDIAELYNADIPSISNIKYKRIYRHITQLYNLEEIWKPRDLPTKHSEEFIDFIFECIQNNTSIDDILLDERCEINDKNKLSHYISIIKTGRLYRNKLIKNRMYTDDINNPINNNTISDEIVISIANDIKSNPKISTNELAKKYNLHVNVICRIKTGRTYTNIIDIKKYSKYESRSFLSDEIVISIANDIKSNPKASDEELSEKYNIKKKRITNIRNGKTYNSITGFNAIERKLPHISDKILISISNELKANPKISTNELAKKYNLSDRTISSIRTGDRHSSVTGIKKGQYKLKCIIDNSTIESIANDIKENPKILLIDICKKYGVSISYAHTIKTKIIKEIE